MTQEYEPQKPAPISKPPKPPKPPTIKPHDNPKDLFKGKKVWKQAETVEGNWLLEEIFRRIQLAVADVLVGLEDELTDTDSGEAEPLNFRAKIYERMKKRGGHA